MKRGVIKIFLLFLCFVSCAGHKNNDVVDGVIQFSPTRKYPVIDLNLSDIADIEFVQLKDSDSAFIFQPFFSRNTYIGDSCIIVGNYTPRDFSSFGIYRFDRQGNFLNKISGYGRGPGEFASLAYMSVESDSSILLFSLFEHKIVKVNSKGDILGSWFLPRGHSEAELLGNSVIIYDRLSIYFNSKGQLVERGAPLKVYDLTTSEVSDLLNKEYLNNVIQDNTKTKGYSDPGFQTGNYPNLIKTKDGLYLASIQFDTIYFINRDLEVKPKICIDKTDIPGEYYTLLPVVDMRDYILLRDVYGGENRLEKGKRNYYIFLKKENRIYQIRNDYIYDNEIKYSSIFFMDKLALRATYISLNYNIFKVYFNYEYIKYSYETFEDFYKEIPNSIKPVFNSIAEDDNPILAIVKFREYLKRNN
ncbi:MAG: 6-bladed beta-propeller [Lentimicrobiaceae bacterium]|nr:6-bladed beta-propeller [Lentimicrobiaceae bacterium]